MSLVLAIDWIRWAPAIGTFVGGGVGVAAFVRQVQTQRTQQKSDKLAQEANQKSDTTQRAIQALEAALTRLENENQRLINRNDELEKDLHDQRRHFENQLERLSIRVEKCDLEKLELTRKMNDLLTLMGRDEPPTS